MQPTCTNLTPYITAPSPGSIFQIQTTRDIFVKNFSKKGKKNKKDRRGGDGTNGAVRPKVVMSGRMG